MRLTRSALSLSLVSCFLLLSAGCTITETKRVKTGLFDNDLQKILEAYDSVENLERGRATIRDVEKVGFKIRAPNVEQIPGPAAFQRIYGGTFFQGAGTDSKKLIELLEETKRYKAFFFPFLDIVTKTDRWYFSTKETIKEGDDLIILYLFKFNSEIGEYALFYCDKKYVRVYSKESAHAFGQGLIDFVREFIGPTDAIYDLFNKLDKRDEND